MAVMAECPACRNKQAVSNKVCKCGENLDTAKRSKRVRYWIRYRLPGGKQRRESVGFSIDEARKADAKRTVQKAENRILDIKPDSKMTFNELAEWYLDLEKVKALASYWLIELTLKKFNSVFGDMVVNQIKPADLENYQAKRKKEGKAAGTIDHEIGKAKTMIFKAFDNDMVGGETLKAFKRVKKTLRAGEDVRDRILGPDEFNKLVRHCARHVGAVVSMAYYTGMRKGEILNLTWDKVNMKTRFIYLEKEDTKDGERRTVPICDSLYKVLADTPRAIHDSHVFLFRGKPVTDIRTGLRKSCKKAGIDYGRFEPGGFVFHDLRHTFNTNMRKAGVPESVIMDITGHSTREMFDRYNTIDEGDAREAIERLGAFLQGVPHAVPQGENILVK